MAKNTLSSEFRQLDVDQYNEDNFREEDGEVTLPAGVDEETVINHLNKGEEPEALRLLLQNAPSANKGCNEQAKDLALSLVLKVLLSKSIGKAKMDDIISQLDQSLLDVLMKYIYRGFESPSEGSSATLLQWHEKVFNVAGIGCIVRVLSDRKRV
ncbi:Actin-related protein 2/3 complex subunit 5 [Trinorchestia longiramus]|nr:Actin-related protein 2/3 complex subunit 5 [Trinorchestia longiramus]